MSIVMLTGLLTQMTKGVLQELLSTLGVILFPGGQKKQPVVARSSTEAEYRSLAQATADLLWLQTLLKELLISSKIPLILCDNQSAVMLAHNPILHSRINQAHGD